MASGSIKSMNDAMVSETIRVENQGSASTYYKDFTKVISKSGYTPFLVGHRFSGAGYHAYWAYIDTETNTIHIGAAKESGSIANLDVYAYVLWVRNDLL